jgi:hypothetical protein
VILQSVSSMVWVIDSIELVKESAVELNIIVHNASKCNTTATTATHKHKRSAHPTSTKDIFRIRGGTQYPMTNSPIAYALIIAMKAYIRV